MKRWKLQPTNECPCRDQPEDAKHVWVCKGQNSTEVWGASLNNLHNWMASVDTDPNLQHLLLSHLRSWRDTTTNQSVSSLELQSLLDNQAAIGWDRCLEGWLSNQWASTQQCYYNILKSRRTGQRWVISIIKKLCDTAWDLWQHCNEILHHKETHISQEAPRLLRREVTQLFNGLSSSHLRQRDRYLLHLSLGSLQNKDK